MLSALVIELCVVCTCSGCK